MFSLNNKTKCLIIKGKESHAIETWTDHGAIFGSIDIVIKSNCNSNNDSYCRLGNKYELP